MSKQTQQSERFLRRADVERVTGFSIATVYRLAKDDDFPRPVKIGARASAWLESEVQRWMDKRVEASREGGAT